MLAPAAASADPPRVTHQEMTNPRGAAAGFIVDAQKSGTAQDLFAVRFLDMFSGWFGGAKGTLSRTPDSGTDWVSVQSGGDHWIEDIWLPDRGHVFAGATAGWGKDKDPTYTGRTHAIGTDPQHLMRNWSAVLRSKDGGITWDKGFLPTNFIITSLRFFDDQNGYFTSFGAEGHDDSDTWITGDGGSSWTQWRNNGCWCHWSDSESLDRDKWWVAGENFMFTSDGGNDWNLSQPPGYWTFFGVSFADAQNGWAVGRAGKIVRTSDCGRTWAEQNSTVQVDLNSVDFVSPTEGWAVGDAGTIIYTSDAGATWSKVPSPTSEELEDVDFPDRRFGWAVGRRGTVLFIHDGVPPPPPKGDLASVAVTPDTASLSIGETATFSALGYDAAGSPIPGLSYNWAVSSPVGTIIPLGPEKVEFRATSAGSASLSAETSFNGTSAKGSAALTVQEANRPPSTPTLTGVTSGKTNVSLSFSSVSTDPDADRLVYALDWGDGLTDVTPAYASGAPAPASHFWSAPGTYALKAKAEDTAGAASSWSSPIIVTITSQGGGNSSNGTDRTPPAIAHTPPQPVRAGEKILFEARVSDDRDVAGVELHYRLPGAAGFAMVPMVIGAGSSAFAASVQTESGKPGKVGYYIEARDSAGNSAVDPSSAPASLHSVEVRESGGPPPPPAPTVSTSTPDLAAVAPYLALAAAAAVASVAGIALFRRKSRCAQCGSRHRAGEACRGWYGWS